MTEIQEPNWIGINTLGPYEVEHDIIARQGSEHAMRHRKLAYTNEPVNEWVYGKPPELVK